MTSNVFSHMWGLQPHFCPCVSCQPYLTMGQVIDKCAHAQSKGNSTKANLLVYNRLPSDGKGSLTLLATIDNIVAAALEQLMLKKE